MMNSNATQIIIADLHSRLSVKDKIIEELKDDVNRLEYTIKELKEKEDCFYDLSIFEFFKKKLEKKKNKKKENTNKQHNHRTGY